ncbi:D-xylose 1-dehydrogenase (NADP(+)) 2 [Halalkalicoccus paucihalophilus]|uniref:D-xylose 1-dehydrogenase (NADP(+)) 2 n=1 Tax=Halalkalicoccus paucihalophilus TaxID=1008153 RepID=A0A151AFF6_9EURY|nr:Gfo/Idh/MocA family oxidoreductase [Halalkalicoccus paucihalophilus]KYH26389.1 D-xylose 1-dehydrogenase (NADP(+)) 2 [Halalkalicoccus paucihalophilus]
MEFGVLSTAGIARKAFLPAVEASEHTVGAIASRDGERARNVAEEYAIPRHYGSYEALLGDEGIDAVYVPLPNGLHGEWTRKAADADLDVLCEKPLAADAEAARGVVEHCRERGVTLMEGFMYRYHPRTERAVELARGELKGVHSVSATFKFPLSDPEDVRLSPELAGGSLMDVGCYAVSVARLFLGDPERAFASVHDSRGAGVDTDLAGVLEFEGGASARIASGFDSQLVQRYRVEGENGWIEVEDAFDAPTDELTELTYRVDGREGIETFDPVDQFRLEVESFASAVESGESPQTDGAEAVANMEAIDALAESAERGEVVTLD